MSPFAALIIAKLVVARLHGQKLACERRRATFTIRWSTGSGWRVQHVADYWPHDLVVGRSAA